MRSNSIKKVVIAGGGTAGWLAAVGLSRQMGEVLEVVLIESKEIGVIGVGEATIPPMRTFHRFLRIDEREFMQATSATFKLGIRFEDWGGIGQQYIHSFGKNGKENWLADFHNFWLHGLALGIQSQLEDYCFELQAAKAGKFACGSQLDINYAYHLDAVEYAKYLRKISEDSGAKRIEGKIKSVETDGNDGSILALVLESGERIDGDFFIDCTGFSGLLIEKTLHTGYEDWSHWLMCDSAIAVQTKPNGMLMPYTRSIAHRAGWRWRIPLQHRVGNGVVYSSHFMSDDEALKELESSVDSDMISEPRVLKFKTGRRKKAWNKNCLALGLASGFLEPLESTSIHLAMIGVTRFMQMFPHGGFDQGLEDHYNHIANLELEKIRDFLLLHYVVSNRDDGEFWKHYRRMNIPQSLIDRISMFKENAYAYQFEGELFRVDSWTQVMFGQGLMPKDYHPFAKTMSPHDTSILLSNARNSVAQIVDRLPDHEDFLNQYCRVKTM